MAAARVSVVGNEIEAELACSFLRDQEVECFWKRTDVSAGAADAGLSIGGPFEIWVDEADLERARALLPR